MVGFKNKLSQLIRNDLGLDSAAETEIMFLVNAQRSPGRIIRLLTHLNQLKRLWNFSIMEKKGILECICTELENHARSDLFTRLIMIVFGHPGERVDYHARIKNFIVFLKSSITREEYFTIRAGLARVMLLTLKKYPALVQDVDATTVAPSLLFARDSVSYAASLNNLISLFDAPSVIPVVIDLLIQHPRESDLFLTRTLFEYARRLPQDQKVVAFRKLQVFLIPRTGTVSEESIAKLYYGFVLEFGRLYYLSTVASSGWVAAKNVIHPPLVTTSKNQRFLKLQPSKRGNCREPLYSNKKHPH